MHAPSRNDGWRTGRPGVDRHYQDNVGRDSVWTDSTGGYTIGLKGRDAELYHVHYSCFCVRAVRRARQRNWIEMDEREKKECVPGKEGREGEMRVMAKTCNKPRKGEGEKEAALRIVESKSEKRGKERD